MRLGLAATLLLVGRAEAQEAVGSTVQPVIYGADDRLDWYQIPTTTMQTFARDAIVALVPAGQLDFVSTGLAHPPIASGVPTLTDYLDVALGVPLCASERFATQTTAAICSGTLVDDDLVVTAGHCARTLTACRSVKFVFDYLETSDGVLETIDPTDVYGCGRVLAYSERSAPHLDYAVVQLDRPVVGRVPTNVSTLTTPIATSTPLVVIGFGSGLPMKYDAGGAVADPHEALVDAFTANTDTFAGNSGSGVFTTDGTLVGILVAGQQDYVPGATCASVNRIADAVAGETIVYSFRAIEALCAGGFPSAVCPGNPAPTCGDHFCSGGEDAASCSTDCASAHCGDGTCSTAIGETMTSCSYDCTNVPPTYRKAHGRCTVDSPGAPGPEGTGLFLLGCVGLGLVARRRR